MLAIPANAVAAIITLLSPAPCWIKALAVAFSMMDVMACVYFLKGLLDAKEPE
jgi:hypothetical protein